MERVTVRVPATSANIGPGFDSLGMAFSFYNLFSFDYMKGFCDTDCLVFKINITGS